MKSLWITFLILSSSSVMSQQRFENWTKISAVKPISKQLTTAVDVQFRTQSDYPHNAHNPFEKIRTESIRIWLNWQSQLGTEILLSPLAYFITKDYNSTQQEWLNTYETRQSLGLQHSFKYGQSSLRIRSLMELRIINHRAPAYRSRTLIQFKYPLLKIKHTEVGVLLSDEYFYQLFHSQMDNNRMFTGITLQSVKRQFQTGFQWQSIGPFRSGIQVCQISSTLNFNF